MLICILTKNVITSCSVTMMLFLHLEVKPLMRLTTVLPAKRVEAGSRLLDELRRMRDTFGEKLLRARQHVGGRESERRGMDHGVGRIVMPVGCRGTGMLATRARVVRSMTSTAPGSIPTLSWEMKAQCPSGEYATP